MRVRGREKDGRSGQSVRETGAKRREEKDDVMGYHNVEIEEMVRVRMGAPTQALIDSVPFLKDQNEGEGGQKREGASARIERPAETIRNPKMINDKSAECSRANRGTGRLSSCGT